MKTNDAVTALAALSHGTRLDLFRLLVRRGPQGWPAGELARRLGVDPPILSFHAKALEHAGLVHSHPEGRLNIYTANFPAMVALVEFLGAECCSQADPGCVPDCLPAAASRRRSATRRSAANDGVAVSKARR